VILGSATTLARGGAANGLPRLILRWLEHPLAIATSPFDHTRRCRILRRGRLQTEDLETAVECVPHPRRWLISFRTTVPAEMLSF
jgi:hypothetical protein